MLRKIQITGEGGFWGSALYYQLENSNHTIFPLVRKKEKLKILNAILVISIIYWLS